MITADFQGTILILKTSTIVAFVLIFVWFLSGCVSYLMFIEVAFSQEY